jgi:hypothetical protein
MSRLSLLLLALLLAFGAVNLVTGADAFAPYLLRDALFVALLAALLFAWQSGGWIPIGVMRSVTRLAAPGQTLWLTGIVCLVAGGIGAGFDATGWPHLVATLVWGLGALLLVMGVWWPGASYTYAPAPYRWEQDAHGQFVRIAVGDASPPPVAPASPRVAWIGVVLVMLLAIVLRFWNLGALPSGCVGSECIDGLRLVDGQALTVSTQGAFNLYERLARLIYVGTEDGLLSLRIAAALFGSMGVLAFAGVARQVTPPAFVAPVLLLIALNPWHLWASRSSDAWIETVFLILLALWLLLKAIAHSDLRWWTLAGLAWGVLFVEAPPLRIAVLLWTMAAATVGLWRGVRSEKRQLLVVAAALAAMFGVSAPAVTAALYGATLFPTVITASGVWDQAITLAGALLRPDVLLDSAIPGGVLISSLTAALAIVGFGVLVRAVRRPAAILILAGMLVLGAAAMSMEPGATPPRSLLLVLLPFVLTASAVTLDRVLGALVGAWGRVVRPARLVAVTSLLLCAIFGLGAVRFATELNAMQDSGAASMQNDIARYIAQELASGDIGQTFVTPASVLNHPSMRLIAGDAIGADRVRLLDFGVTVPFAAAPQGDVVYLIPAGQGQVLGQVLQFYPNAQYSSQASETAWALETRRASFTVVTVPQQMIVDSQGMQMLLYAGSESGDAINAAGDAILPTTSFDWQSWPPLMPPFSARLRASLAISQQGMVGFFAEVNGDAAVSMLIDDQLVLDTQLGIGQMSLFLAQGVHLLEIDYRSNSSPGDLRLFWQPPGEERAPLPLRVLHAPAVADNGLVGDYHAGSDPAGALLTQRRDRVLGFDFGLEEPYNVHWQGRVGISRAGEYLLATLSDGPNQLSIDGQLVVDGRTKGEDDVENAYNEGLIYLERGWHAISIRYEPRSSAPEFRLLWQPPGAAPGELSSESMLPVLRDVGLVDQPAPPAPPLIDPLLGSDDFALTRATSAWNPDVRIPPSNLAPLPLELFWVAGEGCGDATQQLNAPHGLAFDPAGKRLYVADTGNRRVHVLDLNGGFGAPITDPTFEEPVDIAFAPDGALLMLDAVAGPIYRIDAEGAATLLPLQTSFYRPRGFDVRNDGAIVVADTGGGRVVLLSPEGAPQMEFGGIDTALARGQPVDALFGEPGPWALSAEDGRLWNLGVDGGLTAVQPTNTIDGPRFAALPTGGFLVSDPARRTFTVFTAAGRPVQSMAYTQQMTLPTGIAVLVAGDQLLIAVSDTLSCTVSTWWMAANQLQ